jgi:hypothetical protein
MPLLEVVQTRQISASIRLTDSTATQVDQYAAFIRATSTLRIRKVPAAEASEPTAQKPLPASVPAPVSQAKSA